MALLPEDLQRGPAAVDGAVQVGFDDLPVQLAGRLLEAAEQVNNAAVSPGRALRMPQARTRRRGKKFIPPEL